MPRYSYPDNNLENGLLASSQKTRVRTQETSERPTDIVKRYLGEAKVNAEQHSSSRWKSQCPFAFAQHTEKFWNIFFQTFQAGMLFFSVVFLLCWLRTELNLRWVRDRSSFYSFQRERLDTHIQEMEACQYRIACQREVQRIKDCQKEVQRVSTLQSSLAIFLSRMRTEKWIVQENKRKVWE